MSVAAEKISHEDRLAIGGECLQAALDYAQRGWSPIALCPPNHVGVGKTHGEKCTTPGKNSLGRWKDRQTEIADDRTIRRWWDDNAQCNVGIALGSASGLVRLDIEDAAGEQLVYETFGIDHLAPTMEFVRPGSKSRGLLYAIPQGLSTRLHKVSQLVGDHSGYELLGDGQFTRMPPSLDHRGSRIEWIDGHSPDDIDAAPMPGWMVEAMTRRERTVTTPQAASGDVPDGVRREVVAAMFGEDPGCNRTRWLDILMAMHHLDPSPAMMALCVQWSSMPDQYSKTAPRDVEERWESFGKYDGKPKTVRSVFGINPTPEDAKLDFLRSKLKLPTLSGVVRRGNKRATYDLVLEDGETVPLGAIAEVRSVKKVSDVLLDRLAIAIPMDKREWPEVSLAIRQIAEQVNTGDDDQVHEWLERLEQSSRGYLRYDHTEVGSEEWWAERLKNCMRSGGPVMDGHAFRCPDGHFWFSVAELKQQIWFHDGESISRAELVAELQRVGCFKPPTRRKAKVDGRWVSPHLWCWPAAKSGGKPISRNQLEPKTVPF